MIDGAIQIIQVLENNNDINGTSMTRIIHRLNTTIHFQTTQLLLV